MAVGTRKIELPQREVSPDDDPFAIDIDDDLDVIKQRNYEVLLEAEPPKKLDYWG